MKKLIKNTYANFYLNAAEKLGLEYIIKNEKIGLSRIFDAKNSLDISANILGVNTQLSSSLSVNKVKTSTLLQEENIPVPNFKTFKDSAKAIDYGLKQIKNNKSIVIKPISSSLSIGITVNPANADQIKIAVAEAFEGNSSIMIEKYVAGKHFRITVFDNEIIAITERIASNVTGDGKSTLAQLIKQKNALRKKMKLPSIFLRVKDLDYLQSKKINLLKIYPEDVNITLQLGCDMDIGGERVRIEKESVPEENLDLFIRAANKLSLRFAGIDYITPNIEIPYTQVESAINEINSAPDSSVHYKDTYPNNNYAAERIIGQFFNLNTKIDPLFEKIGISQTALLSA